MANVSNINFNNVSIVVHELTSSEHYKKTEDSKELIPFLNKISFVIEKKDIVGISADNKTELKILIEILGNMRSHLKGVIRLTDLGIRSTKRLVLEKIFFIDSNKILYEDMTLLEQLMFVANILHGKTKANPADLQKSILDLIHSCSLDEYVVTPLKQLSDGLRMVISILVGLMSDSEKIIINAIDYEFSQDEILKLCKIFKYFRKQNKTIILATMQSKMIGMCCNHVLYVNDGQLKVDCTIDELYKKWDKVVCSIKTDEIIELDQLIKNNFKGIITSVVDGILYVKDYSDNAIISDDIYYLARKNNIKISFIRFNSGRVENAFNEIRSTFNDLYK